MKKILLLVATEKGLRTLTRLVEEGYAKNIVRVVSFEDENIKENYCNKIRDVCTVNDIAFNLWKEIRTCVVDTVKELNCDYVFVIGWRYMLPLEINSYITVPMIVLHDSLLPKYRGFCPTVTAMINGENTVGVSAIFAEKEVDTGDIILQKSIKIGEDEYIGSVIARMADLYADIVIEILCMKNNISAKKQDVFGATYSIWRDFEDCKITWNQNSKSIYNFIRALSFPYCGAWTRYNREIIHINKAEIIEDMYFELRDVGKIWKIIDNCPFVICGEGMIKIINATNENGCDVVFNRLRERLQ